MIVVKGIGYCEFCELPAAFIRQWLIDMTLDPFLPVPGRHAVANQGQFHKFRSLPRTPVARVVQIDPVKIMAGVPERFALAIQRGAKATVSFDVIPGEVFEGALNFVGATVDAASRTFLVEMTLPNRDGRIKPEMVATITVIRDVLEDAIVVSQDALVRQEDGFVVFVILEQDGETIAVATPVIIQATQGNDVLISDGLEPGDRYVVVGQQQVADGDRVQVVGNAGTQE